MNRFALLGIDDEVTVCECCGRADLKCTMALSQLDADGNEVAVVRYGRDCGAAALGWKVSADRAEKIARGAAVRFDYEDLWRLHGHRCIGGDDAEGEISGVRLVVRHTGGNKKRTARLVAEGWQKGPSPYVWRLAA